ncbi:LysM peptidoglycan-binding domain-containing M23 family metallopeptidase [Alkalibacillus salilacus]|uniref:Murein DD-endopeptidase MepM/ murein hydrolase activator NlpD n=1 Tax=Alkalibacillus salilacus TaxID=284582 RepID=A0ABT9VBL3_9BACI|nr:M23 family metallopeptidase [Alkalibacillus salilacus]MDQ0158365.1 murein DD-endopeptidase MepM/ murein hydrolase activator NlpD [Alkalibacillus salilacus]
MSHNKTQISNLLNQSWLKKIVVTSVLGAGLIFGTVHADSENVNLSNVYHVYMDDKHIGTVGNKEDIQDFIDEQEQSAEESQSGDNIDLVPAQDIKFVEEFVFSEPDGTDQVKTKLEDDLSFAASAIELTVDDQVLGYVNNLDEANEAVNQVIDDHLPDDVDQDFELLKEKFDKQDQSAKISQLLPESSLETDLSDNPDKENQELYFQQSIELDEGSTKLDVGFTENVSFKETKVESQQLLEVEQLAKLIERGVETAQSYKVKDGETLSTVASKHDLSTDELVSLNSDIEEDSVIQVGQSLDVKGMSSLVDVSYTKEVTEEETIEYDEVTKDTDSLYEGESEVEQEGSDGKKEITYQVKVENGEEVSKEKLDEEVVKEAQDKIIKEGTKVIPSRGTGDFAWPAVGGHLTSTYGPRWGSHHNGIDIAGVSNRTIKAADNGKVVEAGYHSGGHGNRVIIDHNNGYRTLYAHLSSIDVNVGQTVQKGQSIGQMGNTGRSTGVHLHLELKKNGSSINPGPYFK